eukprot:gb/GEZJ01005167.1/.p1 GENE.gb/GEZJ01005167.1/~~gb/GEZJ01005167.1/.p1  ORF type:complete len:202 (-),score=13.08 gb/GEZJ01005167.1/:437-1042(-)
MLLKGADDKRPSACSCSTTRHNLVMACFSYVLLIVTIQVLPFCKSMPFVIGEDVNILPSEEPVATNEPVPFVIITCQEDGCFSGDGQQYNCPPTFAFPAAQSASFLQVEFEQGVGFEVMYNATVSLAEVDSGFVDAIPWQRTDNGAAPAVGTCVLDDEPEESGNDDFKIGLPFGACCGACSRLSANRVPPPFSCCRPCRFQ